MNELKSRPGVMAPELKYTQFALSQIDEAGTFEGYATLFEREDLGHDVVAPGAFTECLARRGTAGIKMLFQHDPNQPIGVWESIRQDAQGLFVRGKLATDVAKAREVHALMRAGALDGLSIGFQAKKTRRDPRSGVRRLEKIDLWEISVVTFPMLPEARVTHVKAGPFAMAIPTEREFERWLTRDAGLSRSEARAVSAFGLKGLVALRDAGPDQAPAARLRCAIARAALRMRDAALRST
jgi:hypothetical protein